MSKYPDLMIDLETMGANNNAPIVAIGAVAFNRATGEVGPTFYTGVNLTSSTKHGGVMDASTVLFWLKQSDEARQALTKGATTLPLALTDFDKFVRENTDPDKVWVWACGTDFDCVILRNAYQRAAKAEAPWKFWNQKDYRTLRDLHTGKLPERTGTHHNALDDALYQAEVLLKILGVEPVKAGGVLADEWEL